MFVSALFALTARIEALLPALFTFGFTALTRGFISYCYGFVKNDSFRNFTLQAGVPSRAGQRPIERVRWLLMLFIKECKGRRPYFNGGISAHVYADADVVRDYVMWLCGKEKAHD